jgi:hypothetical protein
MACGCQGAPTSPGSQTVVHHNPAVAAVGGGPGEPSYYWNGPTAAPAAEVAAQPPQPAKPAA